MAERRQPRGEESRAAVLATARAVLVEEGLERFVLRRIAARTPMALGNLQYYFPTREDLLEAVMRDEFERDRAVLAAELARRDGSSRWVAGVLAGLVDNWCRGGNHVFGAMKLLAAHQPRFAALAGEIYGVFYDELGELLRAADPSAPAGEIAARSRLVTAVLDGTALQIQVATCDDDRCERLIADATALVTDLVTTGAGH
jgi:AcrR family transcriptional regulator